MARPEFEPTTQMRNQVAIAAGAGMSHEEIAIGLGISRPTLAKHFEHELSEGAYARRLSVLQAMYDTAMKGNVTAQRAYIALRPRAAPTPDQKSPAKGKKEQANEDAKTAAEGTKWDGLLRRPTVQ